MLLKSGKNWGGRWWKSETTQIQTVAYACLELGKVRATILTFYCRFSKKLVTSQEWKVWEQGNAHVDMRRVLSHYALYRPHHSWDMSRPWGRNFINGTRIPWKTAKRLIVWNCVISGNVAKRRLFYLAEENTQRMKLSPYLMERYLMEVLDSNDRSEC